MTDWFYPGYKAGGTISTCYNLAMLLKSDYKIYIMTSDRDLDEQEPYENVTINQWINYCENVQIFYASPSKLNWINIIREIKNLSPDCIYLNSMYSLYFTIYPLLMKRINLINIPIVLSPSGMLKESALKLKSFKKKCFLTGLNIIKIQQVVDFQAADSQERMDIIKAFGEKALVSLVPYAPPPLIDKIICPVKTKGSLKLLFTGRIHPIKNLYFLIECLITVIHKVELTIVGPVGDKGYYNKCRKLEAYLPTNIKLIFTGGVSKEKIPFYLNENHFLALPSLGENFSYSIVEALSFSRPVIISDNTPWKNLAQQKVGWDLPINECKRFIEAINAAAEMDQDEYNKWSDAARSFARCYLDSATFKNPYKKLFGNINQKQHKDFKFISD